MRLSRLAKFSWFVLAYNLFVIVFGAFVRATGSGAGCGSHWPLCNGVVVPRAPALETVIEFTHRVTSGVTLLLILALIIWVWRVYPRGSRLRTSSALIGVFIIVESLLGAGLVLFELVEYNASLTRAVSMIAHLANTFLLLASLLVTSWWLTVGAPLPAPKALTARWFSVAGVLGMFLLAASGAITALGDTLFPAGSLAEGLRQDIDPAAHFLIRLRVFHPVIAVVVGSYAVWFSFWLRRRRAERPLNAVSSMLAGLFGLQLALGMLNIILLAPVWLQLVHLLVTTLIWLCYVMVTVFAWVTPDLVERVGSQEVYDPVKETPAGQSVQPEEK